MNLEGIVLNAQEPNDQNQVLCVCVSDFLEKTNAPAGQWVPRVRGHDEVTLNL